MPLEECPICRNERELISYHDVNNHSFCDECTATLRATGSRCPLCRAEATEVERFNIPRPPPLIIPPRETLIENELPVVLRRANNRGWFSQRESFPEATLSHLNDNINEYFENNGQSDGLILERWVQAVHHYGRLHGILRNPSERNVERLKMATSYFRMLTETTISRQATWNALRTESIPPPNRRVLERVFRCLSTISRMFYGDELTHSEPRQTSLASRAYDILFELVRDRASPEEIQMAANLYALVSRRH